MPALNTDASQPDEAGSSMMEGTNMGQSGHLIVQWHSSLSHEQGHHCAICVCVLLRAQYQGGEVLQPGSFQSLTRCSLPDTHSSKSQGS